MRLDRHLVHAGLAPSRTAAARLIREGRVLVHHREVRKPALDVAAEVPVRILPGPGAD